MPQEQYVVVDLPHTGFWKVRAGAWERRAAKRELSGARRAIDPNVTIPGTRS